MAIPGLEPGTPRFSVVCCAGRAEGSLRASCTAAAFGASGESCALGKAGTAGHRAADLCCQSPDRRLTRGARTAASLRCGAGAAFVGTGLRDRTSERYRVLMSGGSALGFPHHETACVQAV